MTKPNLISSCAFEEALDIVLDELTCAVFMESEERGTGLAWALQVGQEFFARPDTKSGEARQQFIDRLLSHKFFPLICDVLKI